MAWTLLVARVIAVSPKRVPSETAELLQSGTAAGSHSIFA